MNTFNCIKCKESYSTPDVEAYYCAPCLEVKKAIAVEIDKKVGSTVGQQPKSDLSAFEDIAKSRGGFKGNDKSSSVFVNVRDIGLTP